MSDTVPEPSEQPTFHTLLEHLRPNLSLPSSKAYSAGVCGSLHQRSNTALFAGDVWEMLLPGLEALGWRAEATALASTTERLPHSAQEKRQHTAPTLFALFSTDPLEFLRELDRSEMTAPPPEPILLRLTLTQSLSEISAFQVPNAYAFRLSRAERKGFKRDNLRAALLRLAACGTAFPQRLPQPQEDERLQEWQAFLAEAVGAQHTPFHNRLRYAHSCFEAGDSKAALGWLKEAALWEMGLLPSIFTALAEESDTPLSDALRRELIYLARAGQPPLRALSAARLHGSRAKRDVKSTLETLQFDRNYWVREIARRAINSSVIKQGDP